MEIAESQHGVITRTQLIESGRSLSAIDRMIRARKLKRFYPGVYGVAGAARSEEQSLMALCLSYRFPVWLSHSTAAKIHGLRLCEFEFKEITFGNQFNAAPRDGIRTHETRSLDVVDFTVVKDLPVTSVARTIVDLAQHLNDFRLGIALDDALMRRLVTLRQVENCFDRVGKWAGRKRFVGVKLALEQRIGTARAESGLERKVLRTLRSAGLTTPRLQWTVVCGSHRYRLDMAYPEERLAIEVDGFATHRERSRFDSDRERDAELQRHGWRVLHVTSNTSEAQMINFVSHFLLAS